MKRVFPDHVGSTREVLKQSGRSPFTPFPSFFPFSGQVNRDPPTPHFLEGSFRMDQTKECSGMVPFSTIGTGSWSVCLRMLNKKVLLRECKRHTACHIASALYAALSDGGVPHSVLVVGGNPPPSRPGWGVPPTIQTWPGGYPWYPPTIHTRPGG